VDLAGIQDLVELALVGSQALAVAGLADLAGNRVILELA
jgi:hypothetical protein